jgi:gluconate 5-dehydrogenase
MSLFALHGRTAVVTGGGSGLGRLFALALAEAGAAVAVLGRRPDPLESTAEQIRRLGRNALAISADVTDESAVRAAIDRVLTTFETIDVLVNNAVGFHRAPVSTQPLAEWRRVLDVSVTGAFLCCRAVGAHMISRPAVTCLSTPTTSIPPSPCPMRRAREPC